MHWKEFQHIIGFAKKKISFSWSVKLGYLRKIRDAKKRMVGGIWPFTVRRKTFFQKVHFITFADSHISTFTGAKRAWEMVICSIEVWKKLKGMSVEYSKTCYMPISSTFFANSRWISKIRKGMLNLFFKTNECNLSTRRPLTLLVIKMPNKIHQFTYSKAQRKTFIKTKVSLKELIASALTFDPLFYRKCTLRSADFG